ncbi:MAG: hypothetical protein KAY08_01830 [Giesbergeria sp.]|nr:hypothetical protein [Giesbergeria sp.]
MAGTVVPGLLPAPLLLSSLPPQAASKAEAAIREKTERIFYFQLLQKSIVNTLEHAFPDVHQLWHEPSAMHLQQPFTAGFASQKYSPHTAKSA